MNECKIAKELLCAVWERDSHYVEALLELGASPNWVFNGYPILFHALYLDDWRTATLLIRHGAVHLNEALGFVLDRGIAKMIKPLLCLGAKPVYVSEHPVFGLYPSRCCLMFDKMSKRKKVPYESKCQLYQNAFSTSGKGLHATHGNCERVAM